MAINFKLHNILSPHLWAVGPGGTGSFGQNGATDENERVIGTDPWGNSAVVWESRPNGSGGADGGWNNGWYSIDEYSLYRWSVWVKRITDTAGGTSYFGLYGNPNAVIRLDNGAQEGNPYWECNGTGAYTKDVWYLLVGHCFPSNYNGGLTTHPDSGRYITTGRNGGVNYCNIGGDVKWYPGTTLGYHRTYHYYCSDNTTKLQWFEPRFEKCDGTEPSINELLSNNSGQLASTSITVDGASQKNQSIIAYGGDEITELGEWRIHRFNSSGTLTVSNIIGSSIVAEYLVVGGGGGGGMDMGGGGGGGGVISGTTVLTETTYTVVVGAGGTGGPAGCSGSQPCSHQFTIGATKGGDSSVFNITANGGGFGASSYYGYTPNYGAGGDGANGGGASGYTAGATVAGGAGSQGFRGGNSGGGSYYSGGGGGAGAQGTDGPNRPDGGNGKLVQILNKPFYWGGGGGGASYSSNQGGFGGLGGGGGGAIGNTGQFTDYSVNWGSPGTWGYGNQQQNVPGGNGGANTGGGGGGGSHYNRTNQGGNGGSGIVIIRYKIK